jgi:hypothetical protein
MIAPNEHELLQQADDRIAEWRRLIAKQKRRVADLQRDGHNAGGSMKSWNYTARLYRPRAEILSGKWTFPQPQPAN